MNGDEAKLKRAIIEEVSAILKKKPLEVAKHPIGIQNRVDDVTKMLKNGVRVVGIHGMAGIGKTTIAKAVYNELAEGFNGATCFISNIREKSGQPNGLVALQKQVFLEIFKDGNIFLSNVEHGVTLIKERARRKSVLLILDDVDSREQLDALFGGREWFGSGSVIIITTRDEKVLLDHNVKQDEIYKPQELNEDLSRELFMLHAFDGEQPQGEHAQLSNQVVAAAGGLPLTLEVIGSLFSDKNNVQEWKDTLEELKKIPRKKVQQRLKLSYDNLEDLHKKIFLDIACFFIGENRENDTYMWEGCDWFPKRAVKVLLQRSLLKIDEKSQQFEMHDQIRDMGRAIVDEECSGKLYRKSRLWTYEDSCGLLHRKVPGTTEAEGIRIPRKDKLFNGIDCVSAECIENMPSLRCLQAEHVNFQGKFQYFPTDLKWLHLEWCHFDPPPSDFNVEKLVILQLYETNVAPILTNQQSPRLKTFERLKVLSLFHVETKITLDFTKMPSLVKLQFKHCSELTTIDESIGKLEKLKRLETPHCQLLRKLPDSIWQLSSLEVLNIAGCSKVSILPEQLGELGSLKELDLRSTCIEVIPDSICQLNSLKSLNLSGCENQKGIIAASIQQTGLACLTSLESLSLIECKRLEYLPQLPSSLLWLDANLCTNLRTMSDISGLKSLKGLSLGGCKQLEDVPDLENRPRKYFKQLAKARTAWSL